MFVNRRFSKERAILRKSNKILRDRLQEEFLRVAEEVTANVTAEDIGFLQYISLMEKLGYAADMNEATAKLIERIWIHLGTPNVSP